MKPTEVKEILSHIISTISNDPSDFLQNPSKDFTRNRKLSFETIIKMMIGMGGNSLCKEIYDWFNYSSNCIFLLVLRTINSRYFKGHCLSFFSTNCYSINWIFMARRNPLTLSNYRRINNYFGS